MVAGTRRGGKPRTKSERQRRHKSIYGSTKLPKRGTGVFCRRLNAIIKEESTADKDYKRLLTYAPTGSKKTISAIRSDEKGHRKKLINLRNTYCR